jgi:putative ABC transport system ATP-binding protein
VLTITDLRKSFPSPEAGGRPAEIVSVAHFALGAGEQLALRGESGSGKTTFLNLIAGLLAADSGRIEFDGTNLVALGEAARDRLRAERMGVDRAHARSLLERVGLGSRLQHFPRQLSTGQQQRVAVARALANRPRLVLADEPTGNLDRRRGQEALALIREACAEAGAALLLVSHDPEVLGQFSGVRDFAELNRPAAPSAT